MRPFHVRARAVAAASALPLLACLMAIGCSDAPGDASQPSASESAVVACGARFVDPGGDDSGNDCLARTAACRTIQHAVDAACPGDAVHVAAGEYVENVDVQKPVTIAGDGVRTIVRPAFSSPDPCVGSALCGGAASTVILVESSDVTIRALTIDGDNPAITSGIARGGADLDARNGIVAVPLLSGAPAEDVVVRDVIVRNVFLRGIMAATGGTFRFEDCAVDNVQGDDYSVAVFDFGSAGVVARTRVSNANDAISANHSLGVTFVDNVVRRSGSGLHTDNAGDSAGASPDLIANNRVSDCTQDGWGVFVFIPFGAVSVRDNDVRDCGVGLAMFGQATNGAATFRGNRVEDAGVGVFVTTDQLGYGTASLVSPTFVRNDIRRAGTGVVIRTPSGVTAASLRCNRITHGGAGVVTDSAAGALRDNVIDRNGVGVDATAIASGTLDARENYWGCPNGPGAPGCDTASGNVDTSAFDRTPPLCALCE